MSRAIVWCSTIVGAVAGAVVGFLLERFADVAAVEALTDFFARSWFVWLGLGVGAIVWAFLSVWRVTHGRDDEFTKWFEERRIEYSAWLNRQQMEVNQAFSLRFTRMAGDVKHQGEEIDRMFERRRGAVEEQLADHQERLRRLEHPEEGR
jgi:hypothetical protein